MAGYIRRYTYDPGDTVLTEIESVNVLDMEPPASFTSVGSGTALLVGEFEDGDYNVPTEVMSTGDLQRTFGSFGFNYNGDQYNTPCAVKRLQDSAITAEYWNGNGMIALNGKKFSRLVCCRVDTSVGEVQFTRLPSQIGAMGPTWQLAHNQTFIADVGAGDVTATFLGVAATTTGLVFPGGGNSGFVGGEWIDLKYDNVATFRVTFVDADETPAQVAARINLAAGFTFASVDAAKLKFDGIQMGTGGYIEFVGSNVAGTLTAIGLGVAGTHVHGTGSAVNILAITAAELDVVISAAMPTVHTTTNADGYLVAYTTSSTLTIHSAYTAVNLGFTTEVASTGANGEVGTIPAGFRVQNAGGTHWVTTQSCDVTAASAGPYTVHVRHAIDDGTGVLANASTVNVIHEQPSFAIFSVNNVTPFVACLTEAQLDAAYVTAFASTIDISNVSREVNLSWCARSSIACRAAGLQNAIDASANGCYGRTFCASPPLGTTRAIARGAGAPGVGTGRHERRIYCFPGVRMYVPMIASKGVVAGGAGFTADGYIDSHSDGFMVSVCSRLNPEENPGQLTDYLGAITGLESGAEYSGWDINDYKAFRLAGIAAPRMDEGTAIFQSGVTSVDPSIYPNKRNIARRRMADMIQDTLARRAKSYSKKLNTRARRDAFVIEANSYLSGLLSKNTPTSQRIAAYEIDAKTPNTSTSLALGIFRVKILVRTLSSMDSIVLDTQIGESVELAEV
jgi:hypothetical protein